MDSSTFLDPLGSVHLTERYKLYYGDYFAALLWGVLFWKGEKVYHAWFSKHVKPHLTFKSVNREKRAAENTFLALYYLITWAIGMTILMSCSWPWIYVISKETQPVSLLLWLYYFLQLGFYSQALVKVVLYERNKMDFTAYIFHHVATISLIVASRMFRRTNAGLVIFLLHDFSDIFLHIGKTGVVMDTTWLSNSCMAVFTLSFVAARLVGLPVFIYHVWQYAHLYNDIPGADSVEYHLVLVSLCTLQVLHIFWFFLILSSIYHSCTRSAAADVRELDDDDASPETNQNQDGNTSNSQNETLKSKSS
eukprot:TRINITY_DN9072_c0_g1_i2.p1 TRINITY_DN9072_c0_g1~~TRINITY_DN9072_c0_g1_i2.p1  ORF type:complete len:307 (-),score=17.62 TRINITY_DN9072_c0_g1_i2:46-966(-)